MMNKRCTNESLDNPFPKKKKKKNQQGARAIEIPLDRELTDDEADGYADKLRLICRRF